MTYRPGDVETALGPLRLTVGGLAEIAARLDTSSPAALADRLRSMGPETARHLLVALLRPCGGHGQVASLPEEAVAAIIPEAARCIADALAEQGGDRP